MPRKGGRPTKLTPEVKKILLDTIATGVPLNHAAKRAAITRGTLWGWLRRGEEAGKGEFFDFLNAVKKAEAEAVTISLARIRKAGAGGQVVERSTKTVTTQDRSGKTTTTTTVTERFSQGQWAADAWFLERCHSSTFALWRKKDLQEYMKTEVDKAAKEGRIKRAADPQPGAYEMFCQALREGMLEARSEYKMPPPPQPPVPTMPTSEGSGSDEPIPAGPGEGAEI
jgi:hypothetical protein